MICPNEEHEVANKEQQCVTYCVSKHCKGIPVHSGSLQKESECPICYNELKNPVNVVRLGCNHYFCNQCYTALKKICGCPICKRAIKNQLTLTEMISCKTETWNNIIIEHILCIQEAYPKIKHYLNDLNVTWRRLVNFILETQRSPNHYKNVQGLEIVDFDDIRRQGRLLEENQDYAVLKMEGEKTQLIFSCLLPCMSFRLVISPNDESDFGQDNEYADEAVGCMNEQLEVCWRVFPRLVNHEHVDHLLVRKFQNITCYLLLTGFNIGGVRSYHFTPMKAQLGKLKKCNFDESYFDDVRSIFPLLNMVSVDMGNCKDDYVCCKFYGAND